MNRRSFVGTLGAIVLGILGIKLLPDIPPHVGFKTRKLKAVYTIETEQDLRMWHKIDGGVAEGELQMIIAQAIHDEMDNHILDCLYKGSIV